MPARDDIMCQSKQTSQINILAFSVLSHHLSITQFLLLYRFWCLCHHSVTTMCIINLHCSLLIVLPQNNDPKEGRIFACGAGLGKFNLKSISGPLPSVRSWTAYSATVDSEV